MALRATSPPACVPPPPSCADHQLIRQDSPIVDGVAAGGPDAAIIESVMNPIANVPGLVGPLLATFFLRRFGSRMPLFALAALCQASAAAVFCRWASDRPARDIVTAQQRQAARRDE